MHSDWPLTRDLVLVGGGHTHALVLKKWGMQPLAGTRVTLIDPEPAAAYTGMLPGHIAGHYKRGELSIDLVRLARFARARIVFGRACGIDRQARLIQLEDRPPIRYDIASIDIGATAELPGLAGFEQYGHSVKPLGPFASAWEAFLETATTKARPANCIVIGAGIAGVELALAMAFRLKRAYGGQATVTLLEKSPDVLGDTGSRTRAYLLRALSSLQVTVLRNTQPAQILGDRITLSDGKSLPADFVVSAAGARSHAWIASTGLAHTGGFINVAPDLRSLSDPNIFAAGDCAHLVHAPRPKAGVYAVREAPVLYDNLKAVLSGEPTRPYYPQTDYLKLISTGEKSAVAQKHGISVSGPWVWRLKDRIDAAFMAGLRDLPRMSAPETPRRRAAADAAEAQDEPLCGGCGSKVGRASLTLALAGTRKTSRADIMAGIGDDAAILRVGDGLQVISADHLRGFVEDPYLVARIAAVHALGDVWAMGAEPQSGLLSLIIPRMSERMQSSTVAEVVAAVRAVLSEAGAELVGGHTSMGSELTVGLTVTGLVSGSVIGLAGAKAGDALVLTKPIGTGVILAADMRGAGHGPDIATALMSMQRPLTGAARILRPAATAMTDVTGFGLAGHLMNILDASNLSARVFLSKVPTLPGAVELAAQGIRSSLWHSNAALESHVARPQDALGDLVYDPQTAGGLLAALPPALLPSMLDRFAAAGEPVFVIGELEAGPPRITFT